MGGPVVFQKLVIQNTGDTSLAFGSRQLVGPGIAAFQLGFNSCPGFLGPGSVCAMDVGFRPPVTGPQQATLRIDSDDPATPLDIPLSGTGTNAHAAVSPASIDFGELEVGTTSPKQTVTVENDGTGSLSLGGVWIQDDDGDFQIVRDGCAGRTLGAGETCALDLVFAPDQLGVRTATLSIDSNRGSSSVQLNGVSSASGNAYLSLAPNPLDFGSVTPGSSKQLQVHVSNTGDGTLVFEFDDTEPILTGDIDEFDFIEAGTCGNLLRAGASCTATFVFRPTSNGSKSASFGVPTNATNSPTTLELRGYGGTPPPPSSNPAPSPASPSTAAANEGTSPPFSPAPATAVRLSVRWQQASQVVVLRARSRGLTATYEVNDSADIRISLRNRAGKTLWSITNSVSRAGAYEITVSRRLLRPLHGRYSLVVTATHDDQHAKASMKLRIKPQRRVGH